MDAETEKVKLAIKVRKITNVMNTLKITWLHDNGQKIQSS